MFPIKLNNMRDLIKREEVEYQYREGLFTFKSEFKGIV